MVWGAVAAVGAQMVGGYLSGRSARKQGRLLNSIAEAEEMQRRDRSNELGGRMSQLNAQYGGAYKFNPVTSRNAFGSAGMDQYGNTNVTLDPTVQGWADQYGNLAQNEYDQLQGLDRNAMAQTRMGQLSELQRPGDEQARTGFMDDLRRRGLMGFAKVDNRTGGVANPFATAFESARATRDLQSAYDTTDWVENNIQNRLRNYTGLRGSQADVMDLASNNLQPMQWGFNARRNADIEAAKFGYMSDLGAFEQQLDGRYASPEYWNNSRAAAGASGQASQGMIRGMTQGVASLANSYFSQPQTQAPIENRTMPSSYGSGAGWAGAGSYGGDYPAMPYSGVQVNPINMPGNMLRRNI